MLKNLPFKLWQQHSMCRFWLACVTAGATVGIGILVYTPQYQANDDPYISMIAAGDGVGDAPSGFLVFPSVLLGRALSAIYTVAPAVPVYGIHLLLAHFLALAGIIYATLDLRVRPFRAYLLLLYLASAGLYFVRNLQYTTAAFQLSLGGYLLLLALSFRERPLSGRWLFLRLLFSAVLLNHGAMLRFDAFGLATIVSAPVFLTLGFHGAARRKIREWSSGTRVALLVFAVVSLSTLTAVRFFDRSVYSVDPQWKVNQAQMEAQLILLGCLQAEYSPATAPAFKAVGWSDNDLMLYQNFLGADVSGTYRVERIWHFVDEYQRLDWIGPRARIRLWFEYLVGTGEFRHLIFLFPTFILCLAISRQRMMIAAALTSAMVLLTLLVIFRKAPERVFYPLFSFPAAVALLASYDTSRRTTRVFWILTCLAAVCGLGIHFTTQWTASVTAQSLAALYEEDLHDVRAHAGDVFVCSGSGLPIHYGPPLRRLRWPPQFRLLCTGWNIASPAYEKRRREAGIDDVYRALFERPGTYLICRPVTLKFLKVYIREHYGLDVVVNPRQELRTFTIFQVCASGQVRDSRE